MSQIFVHGIGAVSPAGWGINPLREALSQNVPLPPHALARPGWTRPLRVRTVPRLTPPPAFLRNPRLRRSSPIAQFAMAAALEALGVTAETIPPANPRLSIVFCVMAGCVNYSRRFYDETLKDPGTASPLIFPETVFNAPMSHIGALLGATAGHHTLVGDPGTVLQGLALAADWLSTKAVDGCLVIGAEEMDWITADAVKLFNRNVILAEGAGAIYLRREPIPTPAVQLGAVTDAKSFSSRQTRAQAALAVRRQLNSSGQDGLLVNSRQQLRGRDDAEKAAWADWHGEESQPKHILGEGLAAAAAWQCVAAVDALRQNRYSSAVVSVVGTNQQAIAAEFRGDAGDTI